MVVDGSNIATEGRSTPSLAQLNDAVMAFRDEFPDAVVTVVVDATFGHRIDRREAVAFDEAVAHNELVAPPAGAIGRGDAFVLSIANKVGARILSNDSFQEFHGDYPWLFDEGRLIGGKPVPFVGWVFVERLPVKGPVSRKAQRAGRGGSDRKVVRRSASREASQPMPVPTAPPPSVKRPVASVTPNAPAESAPAPARPAAPGGAVNDLLPFLDFVEHHPISSSVNGVVESYSSHGAYVTIGDIRGYVPLRLMGDAPPRSAREVMRIGDAVTLVVTSFAPARRSVELAVPAMAPGAAVAVSPDLIELVEAVAEAPTKKAASKRATAKKAPAKKEPAKKDAAKKAPAKKEPAKKEATKKAAAKKEPARKAAAKQAAQKAPAMKATATKESAKRVAAKQAVGTTNEGPPTRKRATRQASVRGGGQQRGRGCGRTFAVTRFATWNVNSLKVRQERVDQWLADIAPDIVCLQETKIADSAFPQLTFEAMGYDAAHHGEGRWNGVAILSRQGPHRRLVRVCRRRASR